MAKPGTTADRGYGSQHQAARAAMKLAVDAGQATCSICLDWISPGEPWDADHTDDRTSYRGPAHRSCNRRAGAIKGNQSRGRPTNGPRRWDL